MDTGKPTPTDLFSLPARYVVPLFQREYVWTQEYHWEPLWDDIHDTALRLLKDPNTAAHFLGAIVLKPLSPIFGEPQRYLVVDGQQRLTTLQLALAGFRSALDSQSGDGYHNSINSIRTLTENRNLPEEQSRFRYKIVPFNEEDDRVFQEIIDTGSSSRPDHPMAQCHAFYRASLDRVFSRPEAEERVAALLTAVSDRLQIVSLSLDANENEHLIFETLNARAEPLTEWEKARNLFLARASEQYDKEAEKRFYGEYLEQFDTDKWWTEEIWAQRWRGKRVGLFLRHWLEVTHKRAIPHHRVYYWFRKLTRAEDWSDVRSVAESFVHYAKIFRQIESIPSDVESIEGRFFYRRNVLGVGVVVPLLMRLFDQIGPGSGRDRCVTAIESWLVRRLLAGYNARGYDKLFINLLQRVDRVKDPDEVPAVLLTALQEGDRWPDDQQVRSDVVARPVYPWHAQRRVRMVLEAIESRLIAVSGMAGNPSVPHNLWIEHVLPQSWKEHWPLPVGAATSEEERDQAISTLGNLTLTNAKLDIKLSNRPWQEKRELLEEHDNLFLTKHLLRDYGKSDWNEDSIRKRGLKLAEYICHIWPRPKDP